jgi:hypothetical protein
MSEPIKLDYGTFKPLEPSNQTLVNMLKDRLNYFLATEPEDNEEYDSLLKCYKIMSKLV